MLVLLFDRMWRLAQVENRLSVAFLSLMQVFLFQGAHCMLEVLPSGPTLVNAVAGTDVTLTVHFTGAADPTVKWSLGDLPVVTWTIGSSAAPDIASKHKDVLKLEADGSLTFVNVSLGYTNNYKLEMTKSGMVPAHTSFTLKVFETIENVILSADPVDAIEGSNIFTLQYHMLQGVVEGQTWFFNEKMLSNNSHYSLEQRSLAIHQPNRNDTGQYKLVLTNPFSIVTTYKNVSVFYGPDEPTLTATPAQSFYQSGDSLILSCQAEGYQQPTVEWIFGGQSLSKSTNGILNLTNLQTSQGGTYTCKLLNEKTKQQQQKTVTFNVYERPSGSPVCSVQALSNAELQYHCQWLGGVPKAHLSFPALSNSSSGAGDLSTTVNASANLDGKSVTCISNHPLEQNKCIITARSPIDFLPAIRTTKPDKIVVTIDCVSEALPKAVVSWFKGSNVLSNGTKYEISSETTQLTILDWKVNSRILKTQNYTCICHNPLGSRRKEIILQGPSISDSSLFPNQDGTIVTLTWEVPPTSIVTGFVIQMKGPQLLSVNSSQNKGPSNEFRNLQQRPGSARSTDIMVLDPKSTYRFRVIPKADSTEGAPSEVHRIGPGNGLSGPAIAGIAAGIPCSVLFLLLCSGITYLSVSLYKKRNRQTRYPVSRAVEKVTGASLASTINAKATQAETNPHNLLTGGLKSPPEYNRLQKASSERSVALPAFVPPPPVRVATTV
ncbi:V-set and immunoglobulin domain-containing protein 10-like [Genypterus blacodes]|uniref:V-set and immunoglobulin domain-containing protein 10-like n=1 Tax=Genypterus blacodes TaxID=154954 RepID=UPI003F7582A6